MFLKCHRLYYYQYYGSWGGWNLDADELVRKTYILKQLKSRQMWSGTLVHQCIERCLKNIREGVAPLPEAEAIDLTIAMMRKDYANSKNKGYWSNPKSCALFEHEYELNIEDQVWKDEADHVRKCLQTFYRSTIYQKLRNLLDDQWLEVEDLSTFFLDETKIFVVLDCSFSEDGYIWIYDWKTGRTDSAKNELQLACYIFYAISKWKVKPLQVKAVEFNLFSGNEFVYQLSSRELASIQEYIKGSIRDMKMLLLDVKNNSTNIEQFACTVNDSICQYCNYRKICTKWN